MNSAVRTVVTFKSTAFNTSERKDYFINPGCFGDDVANWLMEQLRIKGWETANTPGQEDFGWYFSFRVSGIEHCFVVGYRPNDNNNDDGTWIGWLERNRGFIGSVMRARKRGVLPDAAEVLHTILSTSQQIRDERWHFAADFDGGREQSGASGPF